MIRGVDSELNFSRFMKHVERLKRKVYADASFMGKYRLRNRRNRQAAGLAAPGDELPSLVPACLAAANDE
jgi:hypothetical protein